MATPSARDIVRDLLDSVERTYAEQAGITVKDQPAPLFQLLCFALLASARIRADVAVAATRALFDQGWTTPRKLAASTWEQRTKTLNQAGYARYDERTARMLADSTALLLDRWAGDLRRLRADADHAPAPERALLQEFKGIGPVGADIFVREVQVVWDECYPSVDDRALRTARELNLGDNAAAVARLVPRPDLPRLVDALVRRGRQAGAGR